MKQILRFQSELEFQNFFAQIRSAEISDFQAIEGSGGDMGLDGIDDDTAYQVFYPEHHNRTVSKYITKIDEDLVKVVKANDELNLGLKRWIFVVPEDLRPKVVVHLRVKSQKTGLKCLYWGATKLNELANKYPHIKNSFPTIFLPDYAPKFDEIITKIDNLPNVGSFNGIEIIPDDVYNRQLKSIQQEYRDKIQNFVATHGTHSSAYIAADDILRKEANKKTEESRLKKEKSDKAYQIALDELNESFDEKLVKLREDFSRRGIYGGGIMLSAEGKLQVKKQRAIDKLNLIFGKNSV